jgi:uroporphyrinogen decarboxylase
VPLIGFAGSPWTLATYMVEGGSSRDFRLVKGMLFQDPAALHRLLELLADAVAEYLNGQIAAGAQALMIFDTWGGILNPRDFRAFSLAYMSRVIGKLSRGSSGDGRIPVILFTRGAGGWLESIAQSGCDAIGIDWNVDIGDARAQVGDRVALQGNLDPCVLYASPERIRQEVATVLESYGPGPGHIFNLGHGVHPQVNPEHVAALVEAVHDLSPPHHP